MITLFMVISIGRGGGCIFADYLFKLLLYCIFNFLPSLFSSYCYSSVLCVVFTINWSVMWLFLHRGRNTPVGGVCSSRHMT